MSRQQDRRTPVRQVQFTGRRPLHAAGRLLTDVAMGRKPADRIITGGRLMNVHTREILDADVAIAHGRVACFGDVSHARGPATEVIDAERAYLVPGLIDTHVHVESTLVTVGPFADAVLPAGTTTVLIENHDMANVFGAEGIRWMLAESRDLLLKVLLAVPACVPPLPGLEDSGAWLDPADVAALLDEPGVGALGEMMNSVGIADGDDRMHGMIEAALSRGLLATGHWALSGWTDHRLHSYAACGIDSCHESVTVPDALAKLRAGMWVQFREGAGFHDMAALAPLLTEGKVDPRHVMFITDDVDPVFLLAEGHLDNSIRVAVSHGVDPVQAIQACTVAPAEYLGLRHDVGSIAPGRFADILFVTDLTDFRPHRVLVEGNDLPPTPTSPPSRTTAFSTAYPPKSRLSVRLTPADLTPTDLRIPAPAQPPAAAQDPLSTPAPSPGTARVRAIGMVNRVLPTEHRILTAKVAGGEIPADPEADLAKLILVNRHGSDGHGTPIAKQVAQGFVQGLGLATGAIAQSTARDTHHLLVVGMNDADMLAAARAVIADGGGIAVARGGAVTARLPLPIAGLLTEGSVEDAAAGLTAVLAALTDLGCAIEQPTMMLAMLAVSAIPELRIGNRGLIDSRDYRLVPPVLTDPS
jgi:adenine deaminase